MRKKEPKVRLSGKEITDPQTIGAVLRSAKVCRIGLCDGQTPYVVPLCFGYENGVLYFHCATAGRKLDVLAQNPSVCVEAESDVEFLPHPTACGWNLKYRSVIGFGQASRVEDPAEKLKALRILMAHYAEGPFTFSEKALDKTAVIRVQVERWTGKQSGY